MAGSSECPVKISYRKEKMKQQQQQEQRTSEHPTTPHLSSPARLYSNVLRTLAPSVHASTKPNNMSTTPALETPEQSSVIINALKGEILKSQDILLNRITALEVQCNAAHEQQATLQWTLNAQIVPYMTTMSELLVDLCERLTTSKVVSLSDNHRTKIQRLQHPPTLSHTSLSFHPFSNPFSSTSTRLFSQQPASSNDNRIYSAASASVSIPSQ